MQPRQSLETVRPVAPSVVASRDPTTAARSRTLAGDLDAVVLRALDPDPGRRHASAERLAEENERWQSEEAERVRGLEDTFKTETERRLEAARATWEAETNDRLVSQESAGRAETEELLARAETKWRSEEIEQDNKHHSADN